MHYYQFNIGDYTSHTKGLSVIEDIAYRRIIDDYFLNEQPLIGCSKDVARVIGMREYNAEVEYVLHRFFVLDGDKWLHSRIEKDIEAYRKQLVNKSRAGIESGKARKTKAIEQPLNTCSSPVEQQVGSVEQTNNHEPVTKNQNNPPKSPKGKTPAIEIKTYITECKAQGVKTIPPDDPVFEYATSVGIPEDFLRLAWLEFRDRMIDSGKRYKDWRAAFRKYVRSGYLKLWWVNADGKYELTTAGKQAEQQHRSKQ